MTRLKVVSVMAVAFVLTAFGATSAQAWEATISASADCHNVTVTAHDTDNSFRTHPTGNLVFKKTGHDDVTKAYSFDTTKTAKDQTIATVAATELAVGHWTVKLAVDETVNASFDIPSCPPPAQTCTTSALQITGSTLAGSIITWTIHNPNSGDVNFGWFLKEQPSQHDTGSVTAGHDTTVTTTKVSGTNTLKVVPTAGARPCEAIEKAFAASTPTPTPTSTPEATATPTATATAQPTSTTQPTQTAVPSPPETGQGSTGSGGDNSFVLVLLATVLGTVVVGGTTLALSRKGS